MNSTQPFNGVRILDLTHVLAGPFATYQLAVLGADVIKIENPGDPDMAREWGPEQGLNETFMGTAFLTQGANKRALALDLDDPDDRAILGDLVRKADVLVENYRPGALDAKGITADWLAAHNPLLIHASMSAFGQTGPRRKQTAFDYVIQATSGIMAMTGTPEVNPIKFGSPAIDYATGTTGAFAIATALFQREKTGRGQRIDLAMMDVAIILMSLEVSALTRSGHHPVPKGNATVHATCNSYLTGDGLLMLGASNMKQYRRLWTALGRPDVIKPDYKSRIAAFDDEAALLGVLLTDRSAADWETYLQYCHVPAARVRTLSEALDDPQMAHRAVLGDLDSAATGKLRVPLTAFKLEHGGATLRSPPPEIGAQNVEILREIGYDDEMIKHFLSRRGAHAASSDRLDTP